MAWHLGAEAHADPFIRLDPRNQGIGSQRSACYRADDAAALRARLGPDLALAVVGAGLMGREVAASARRLGAEVHLIDIMATPMALVVEGKSTMRARRGWYTRHPANTYCRSTARRAA
jgi:NADPH-dependent 2,4-dienoyl-CoA reductase/sulfur reductase-like enzyme